jgi:type VI secretion system protein ImpH
MGQADPRVSNGAGAGAATTGTPADGEGAFEHAGMAVAGRRVNPVARERLFDGLNTEPWSFDFFSLVRRIEALHPDQPGFGFSNRATEDPLRFCQKPSLAFPPNHIADFSFPTTVVPARLFVQFMGMFGPHGPLPLHLTEHAYQRELHHKDRTFARFMDVFTHRMVSLHYRAWASCSMPASFDRWMPVPDGTGLPEAQRNRIFANDRDRYAVYIGSLFGLGMDSVRHRDAVPDTGKVHFAGRLASATKGPEGLAAIVGKFFGVPATVEEFVGMWVRLPANYYCALGGGPEARRPGADLSPFVLGTQSGGCIVAGKSVFDAQGKFRVRVGPMDMAHYLRFLPGSLGQRRLEAWIRNYVGDQLAWEVLVCLRKQDVKSAKLGGSPKSEAGARLGWTTWMMTGKSDHDRADLLLRSRH